METEEKKLVCGCCNQVMLFNDVTGDYFCPISSKIQVSAQDKERNNNLVTEVHNLRQTCQELRVVIKGQKECIGDLTLKVHNQSKELEKYKNAPAIIDTLADARIECEIDKIVRFCCSFGASALGTAISKGEYKNA